MSALCPDAQGAGITVAVLDTGINFQHPHILKPAQGCSIEYAGEELVVRPGAAPDRHGHGTCCAALLLWRAPEVTLHSIRVADARGVTDADRLRVGLEAAADRGVDVVLCSLGVRTRFGHSLAQTVSTLADRILVVAAAGADDVYPALCPEALAVSVRDNVDAARTAKGGFLAAGTARPAPGPVNFEGTSLAAARRAAALARFAEGRPERGLALRDAFSNALDVC